MEIDKYLKYIFYINLKFDIIKIRKEYENE